jgi:hypothetical protein
MKDKFKFYIPEVNIVKGGKDKSGNDLMIVSGICSTNDEDSDGENLEPIGFNTQPLLKSGFINWNHQAKNNPNAIIGEPIEASVIDGNKLFIKAVLYSNSKLANDVYNKINELNDSNSTRKIGWSIEGVPTLRDKVNPKRILKANITGVAITHCPKNAHTAIQIVKGEYDEDEEEEFDEDILGKSMTSNPDLTHESVEGFSNKKKKNKIEIEEEDEENKKENVKTKEERNKNILFTKSYVLSRFMKNLPSQDVETYKNIYESFNSKILNQMENITAQKIEKAIDDFSLLLKSQDSEIDDIIEKGENIHDTSNILSAANEMYSKMKVSDANLAFDELTESLIRGGYSLSESAITAQQVIDEFEKNNNGGDTQMVNVEDITRNLKKSFDEKFDKLEKSFNDKFDKLIEDVLKPISKSNANNLLQIKDVEDRIEKSLTTSVGRKSITGAQGAIVERFEKSNDNDKIDLRTIQGVNRLKDVLEVEFSKSHDEDLMDAMFQLEGAKAISDEVAQKLRNKGINI